MVLTLKMITRDWLLANGFEGLFNDSLGCGCKCDDLMPCIEVSAHCSPGVIIPCNPNDCEMGGDCDFHIGPKSPPKEGKPKVDGYYICPKCGEKGYRSPPQDLTDYMAVGQRYFECKYCKFRQRDGPIIGGIRNLPGQEEGNQD